MASTYNKTNDPNVQSPTLGAKVRSDRKGARFAKGVAITPSDTVDLTAYASGVVVTAAGNLKILPAQNDDGATITFTGCAVGFVPPYQVRRVFSTGTTASVASLDI